MLPDAAPGAGDGGPAWPAAAAALPAPAFIAEAPPAELSRGVAGGGLGVAGAAPCAAVAPEPVVGPDCATAAPARVTKASAGAMPRTSLRMAPLPFRASARRPAAAPAA